MKEKCEHIMSIYIDTGSVKVVINMMFYQSMCTDPSMMKILCLVNSQVVGLVGKRIRCIQPRGCLLPLVDYNGLLTVTVIPGNTSLLEDGRMLLSPHNIYQGYPINRKERGGVQINNPSQLLISYVQKQYYI